jgi:hypothetical protein
LAGDLFHLSEEVFMVESWLVVWQDQRQEEQRREFPTYMEAWDFNQTTLKGRGVVTLLTDRPLLSDHDFRNEAAAARQLEGKGRSYVPRKK